MIRQNTERGAVVIGSNVYTNIAGVAASNCFGVKGMAIRSMTDGLVHLLRKESMSKGVRVQFHEDDTISIDLHIMVDHGVNLPPWALPSYLRSDMWYTSAPVPRFAR